MPQAVSGRIVHACRAGFQADPLGIGAVADGLFEQGGELLAGAVGGGDEAVQAGQAEELTEQAQAGAALPGEGQVQGDDEAVQEGEPLGALRKAAARGSRCWRRSQCRRVERGMACWRAKRRWEGRSGPWKASSRAAAWVRERRGLKDLADEQEVKLPGLWRVARTHRLDGRTYHVIAPVVAVKK